MDPKTLNYRKRDDGRVRDRAGAVVRGQGSRLVMCTADGGRVEYL